VTDDDDKDDDGDDDDDDDDDVLSRLCFSLVSLPLPQVFLLIPLSLFFIYIPFLYVPLFLNPFYHVHRMLTKTKANRYLFFIIFFFYFNQQVQKTKNNKDARYMY
jgi:hypothetical protein